MVYAIASEMFLCIIMPWACAEAATAVNVIAATSFNVEKHSVSLLFN